MAGYLEEYGAGEDRKENLVRNTIVLVLAAAILIALGLYLFRPYHQISVTNRFLGRVRATDYSGAYAAWGCTSQKPCPEYPYAKFLEDWGPKSSVGGHPTLRIADTESCGTGVILTVDVSAGSVQNLFVEKGSDSLSFSPVQLCPEKKSPWAIMVHRTIGKMRRVFF